MWLYTTRGFFSIVRNYESPSEVLVRARLKGDLENLRSVWPTLTPTRETNRRDYRFRATIDVRELPLLLSKLASELTYTNFKDAVAAKQGHERSDLYHDVWHVMAEAQDREFAADAQESITAMTKGAKY
jgi:hypothetical protein